MRWSHERRLPLLLRAGGHGLRGPRDVAAGQLLPPARRRQRDGAVLPAARAGLRASASSSSSRSSRRRSEIFGDYAYFSSYSTTWLEHARRYVAAMVERFGLDESSHVVEIASNDGYLLQYFHERGVPVLGVEPAANVAEVGGREGHPDAGASSSAQQTATELASERKADLLLGNNVLAHVPDLNDFVGGMKIAAGRGRADHDGVPAPDAAGATRTSGTRSTTSTSPTSRSPP